MLSHYMADIADEIAHLAQGFAGGFAQLFCFMAYCPVAGHHISGGAYGHAYAGCSNRVRGFSGHFGTPPDFKGCR
jgi:hypothetical protein